MMDCIPIPAVANWGRHSSKVEQLRKALQNCFQTDPDIEFPLEKCNEIPLYHSQWTVKGSSRAGSRVGFLVPQINVALDMGVRMKSRNAAAYFCTHSHYDHVGRAPENCSYRNPKMKGQETLAGRPLYLPTTAFPSMATYLGGIASMSRNRLLDETEPQEPEVPMTDVEKFNSNGYHPIRCKAGDCFTVQGTELGVEVFKCDHAECDCIGFGISLIKKTRKDQYSNFSGKELADLKKSGTEIEERVWIPQLLYMGDTTLDAFSHDGWQKYPNVFCECSGCDYYEDAALAKQEEAKIKCRGHTDINSLKRFLTEHKDLDTRFYIHHLSQAANPEKVTEILGDLENFVVIT